MSVAFADRDRDGLYTWKGVKYPSVTRVLDVFTSRNLQMWSAKMVAEECASIMQKGIDGIIPAAEVREMIMDWQARMTAAIRYRDHKGRIGTLTHQFLYEKAIGLSITDDVVWMHDKIDELGLAKHEGCGDGYATTLAQSTEPYVMAAQGFLDRYKPDFEMIGLEATVINETFGYAGRMDGIMTLSKSKFPVNETWLWSDRPSVRLTTDFKTSKEISPTYPLQLEAYRQAEFIGLIQDESETVVDMTDGTVVVHIKPDTGAKIISFPPDDEKFEVFCMMNYILRSFENMPKPEKVKKIAKAATRKKAEDKNKCPF